MILVTGATGKVGGEVSRELVVAGAPIRVFVRNAEKARKVVGPAVEIAQGDFDDPESLKAAMHGVDKVFLVSPGDPRQEGNVVEAAKEAGVKHIVKLSVLGATPFTPVEIVRWHWQIEMRIADMGIPFTFLRPNYFMQNMLMNAPTIAAEGRFYEPAGNASISMVDVRDIAAVAVAALTGRGHEYRTYEITGPNAVTFADAASMISEAIERPVEYVDMPPDTARQHMIGDGMPEWLADDLLRLFDSYKQGYAATITRAVTQATGKEPITFEQFVRDYAQIFRESGGE